MTVHLTVCRGIVLHLFSVMASITQKCQQTTKHNCNVCLRSSVSLSLSTPLSPSLSFARSVCMSLCVCVCMSKIACMCVQNHCINERENEAEEIGNEGRLVIAAAVAATKAAVSVAAIATALVVVLVVIVIVIKKAFAKLHFLSIRVSKNTSKCICVSFSRQL